MPDVGKAWMTYMAWTLQVRLGKSDKSDTRLILRGKSFQPLLQSSDQDGTPKATWTILHCTGSVPACALGIDPRRNSTHPKTGEQFQVKQMQSGLSKAILQRCEVSTNPDEAVLLRHRDHVTSQRLSGLFSANPDRAVLYCHWRPSCGSVWETTQTNSRRLGRSSFSLLQDFGQSDLFLSFSAASTILHDDARQRLEGINFHVKYLIVMERGGTVCR